MSAKTSQPGRRTPLSLSGAGGATKPTTNTKNSTNGANKGNNNNNNANGHSNSQGNTNQDNKQQKTETTTTTNSALDTKENPVKDSKKQQQNEKKNQNNAVENVKKNEKSQNGVSSNTASSSNNANNKQQKQQEQNKEKQQQNGSDAKVNNEKKDQNKKEENTKSENAANKKEEKEKKEIVKDKKEEKEKKEVVNDKKEEIKETKNENQNKNENARSGAANDERKETNVEKNVVTKMDVTVEEDKAATAAVENGSKSTPSTPKANKDNNKSNTSLNTSSNQKTPKATPTKAEKTPQKSTPNSVKSSPATSAVVVINKETTTAVDCNDVDMESLIVDALDASPIKKPATVAAATDVPQPTQTVNIAPAATSTPGKALLSRRNAISTTSTHPSSKSDVQLALEAVSSSAVQTPERPKVFSHISGRRGIRPISDYTPSKFQSNTQFRESYRRINTELDVTNNTSLNVTVGSEVPNNSSFSFFSRAGRKRDRTPPKHSQSAIGELQTDMDISPPKRARFDFFSVVSSPLSLLRNRFSKTTLQSSTPMKVQQKIIQSLEDEQEIIEVQNVSGVSEHEDIPQQQDSADSSANESSGSDATLGIEAAEEKTDTKQIEEAAEVIDLNEKETSSLKSEKSCAMEDTTSESDIKITETFLHSAAVVGADGKNKRCVVM